LIDMSHSRRWRKDNNMHILLINNTNHKQWQ
jgi:hypothetical protein